MCTITSQAFAKIGVNVVALTRANFTEATLRDDALISSYTRCVYEIVDEKVDICVADFWETTSRRKLVQYTNAMEQDTQRLFTMPKGGAAMAEPSEGFSFA